MVETAEFNFSTIVINLVTQKAELNPTQEEMKKYCKPNMEGRVTFNLDDADKLTKLTVGDLLMRFFDTITFTKQSQLGNYSGIINQINQAKKQNKTIITITEDERKGLEEIFTFPSKEPKNNSSYMFIVKCLEKKIEKPIER